MSAKNRKRVETRFITGSVWVYLPLPHRNKHETLVGMRYTKTDLILLLQSIPGYNPFLEAEGYYFDEEYASEVLIPWIIENCSYPEGKDTGKPFIPERWQWAIYLNMYCWRRGTGKKPKTQRWTEDFRRFTEVFIYVPRKNGKTTAFGAVPALISLYLDPEQRSQNYCCAADTEQASVNFRHAAFMVERNPVLLNRLMGNRVKHSVRLMEHKDGCTLKVLSSIAETKHGTSPCYVGVDEVHAHPNGDLIDVMITGTVGRDQPLTVYTTTADFDRPSTCNEIYNRACAIRDGRQSDPNFLPVIYEASIEDDWTSEKTWQKANPNYGISVRKEYLLREVKKAKISPAVLGRFLRLHLNIKTAVETAWLSPSAWSSLNPRHSILLSTEEIMDWMLEHRWWFSVTQESDFQRNQFYYTSISQYREWYTWLIEQFRTHRSSQVHGAFDNASSRDLAALHLFFPDSCTVIPWYWVPAESIYRRSNEDNVPYASWYAAGLIQNTPLSSISEPCILTSLLGPAEDYTKGLLWYWQDFRGIALDRWKSNFIATSLQSQGIRCKMFPQNFVGMNEPCRKIESWVDQKRLNHGGNPVTAWQISHCQLDEHPTGLIRPSRESSSDKIDGIVSMVMSVGHYLFSDRDVITEIPGLRES